MTVADLKKVLEKAPDHMDIYLKCGNSGYEFGYLDTATQRTIEVSDEGKNPKAKIQVIVLEEA